MTVTQPGMYTVSVIKDQCVFYPPSFYFVDKLNTVAQNMASQINIKHSSKTALSFMTDAPLPPGQFLQLVGQGGEVIEKYYDIKPGDQTFPEMVGPESESYFIQLVNDDGTIRISQKIR